MKRYMRKEKAAAIVAIVAVILMAPVSILWANYYYYSEGQKIELTPLPDKLVVKFRSEMNFQDKKVLLAKFGLHIVEEGGPSGLSYLDNPSKHIALMDSLRKSSNILFIYPVFIWPEDNTEFTVTNQFCVKFNDEVTLSQIERLNQKHGVKVVKQYSRPGKIFLLEAPWGSFIDILELVNLYYENSITEYSAPNFGLKIKPLKTPNDNYYGSQWALPKISAPSAWDLTTGNSDIIVAIIDEGVDLSHEDLDDKLVPGTDVTDQGDNSPQPNSEDGHGTACAGIAAAETNNNQGIAGIAWNCKIMPVQIARTKAGDPNWTYTEWIVSGIDWAVNNGADVLSNSWGGGPSNDDVHNTIINAVNNGREGKGCIVCFASGNDNGPVSYPAKYSEVIAIGATDQNDNRASFSNYGSELDVTAPGVGIYTTDITGNGGYVTGNYYNNFGGTSASCPHVAGLAALVLSLHPDWNHSLVRGAIEQGDDLGTQGWDQEYGWGRINAYRSLMASNVIAYAEGIMDVSPALMDINNDGQQD